MCLVCVCVCERERVCVIDAECDDDASVWAQASEEHYDRGEEDEEKEWIIVRFVSTKLNVEEEGNSRRRGEERSSCGSTSTAERWSRIVIWRCGAGESKCTYACNRIDILLVIIIQQQQQEQ